LAASSSQCQGGFGRSRRGFAIVDSVQPARTRVAQPDYWREKTLPANTGRHPIIKIAFSPAEGQTKGMAKTPKKVKRTPSAAFMKPVQPDDKLALVVGAKPLPRTELTKKLWVYIRKNGLQDAKKRTLINADEAMQSVFNGKKQVSMFEMTKLVSGHVKK
jgi:chromatin remodeling complex protein RSC6